MSLRTKSLPSTYSPYLLCVLSSNLFDSPRSCVCIVTSAPPTTATVTFNVAIIARWGRCKLRGDAGCPIAESLLSILDDEVLSQNAWPTYVASLSTRGIYTRESYKQYHPGAKFEQRLVDVFASLLESWVLFWLPISKVKYLSITIQPIIIMVSKLVQPLISQLLVVKNEMKITSQTNHARLFYLSLW